VYSVIGAEARSINLPYAYLCTLRGGVGFTRLAGLSVGSKGIINAKIEEMLVMGRSEISKEQNKRVGESCVVCWKAMEKGTTFSMRGTM